MRRPDGGSWRLDGSFGFEIETVDCVGDLFLHNLDTIITARAIICEIDHVLARCLVVLTLQTLEFDGRDGFDVLEVFVICLDALFVGTYVSLWLLFQEDPDTLQI
jgi:hypothetical protein